MKAKLHRRGVLCPGVGGACEAMLRLSPELGGLRTLLQGTPGHLGFLAGTLTYASRRSCDGCRASPNASGFRCRLSCCYPSSALPGSGCCCRYCPGLESVPSHRPRRGNALRGLGSSYHHFLSHRDHRHPLRATLPTSAP